MRHAILVLPTLLFIACSSGGAGTATVDPPGGFGVEGSSIPALGPGVGSPTGGNGGGTRDTGVSGGGKDTGTTIEDTGTGVVDTGGGSMTGDEAICAAKCPSDPAVSSTQVTGCVNAMNGAKCAAEYRAYYTCASEKRVCTDSGTTDSGATSTACTDALMALSTCAGG
jgi:hypothetical protein